MHSFDSNGVEIAFSDAGRGAPILLIHGFASNSAVNWADTGWVETLIRARRRVIAIDNRGHGMSEKLYDSEKYAAPVMAGDAGRLLDHLKIARADVMGYSMGARALDIEDRDHMKAVGDRSFKEGVLAFLEERV